ATPERIAALNEQLGLDKPAWLRYLTWLGGLFVGDFGTSSASGGSVAELLGERIGASFILMGLAAVISVPLGIGPGGYQAPCRGRDPPRARRGPRSRPGDRAHRGLRRLAAPEPARRRPCPTGGAGVEQSPAAEPGGALPGPRGRPRDRAAAPGADARGPRLPV